MLEDYKDLEYDPVYKIDDYKGSYPIIQLNRVRKFLIKILKKDIQSKTELEIKRKCAIFTKDLIDCMLGGKKTDNFVEENTFQIDPGQNPFLHKNINIDDGDLMVCSQNEQDSAQIESSLPKPILIPSHFNEKNKKISFTDNQNDSLNKDLALSVKMYFFFLNTYLLFI